MEEIAVKKEKGNLRITGYSSNHILSLLEAKHCKDVFIPECKNGETWGARDLLKLDAWIMRRSYSPFTTIGYEIKCSRADFENDKKWVKYLDLCHEFYFVCPAGLIRTIDIPSRVGLIWVSTTGKLRTKKRASRQEPDNSKQIGLLIYALMSRSKIVANMFETNGENKDDDKLQAKLQAKRDEIERATERKELAYFVRGHIRTIYEDITKKESSFKYREFEIKKFEGRLLELGINWDSENMNWQTNNEVLREIDILGQRMDDYTLRQMGDLGQRLKETADEIRKSRAETKH